MNTGPAPFYVPSVGTHRLESRQLGQSFQVEVMQPLMRRGEGERFPALYLTDGNLAFAAARSISHSLQLTGEVRRFILVGIGYPGENPFAGTIVRGRDLSWADIVGLPAAPRASLIEGVSGFVPGQPSRLGAPAFLEFIRDELVGYVDGAYPTLQGERAFFGHSAGGGFGLYALFTEPRLFNRYILSSPAISYDGQDFGLELARKYIASGAALPAKVVLTVGDQEELEPPLEKWQLVSSCARLSEALAEARIPGLDVTSEIIRGETHMGAWPIAFSQGVRAIYGPAVIPPLEEAR
jgi:uncharacterized protein